MGIAIRTKLALLDFTDHLLQKLFGLLFPPKIMVWIWNALDSTGTIPYWVGIPLFTSEAIVFHMFTSRHNWVVMSSKL